MWKYLNDWRYQVGIVVALIAIGALVDHSTGQQSDSRAPSVGNSALARYACEGFVKRALKSPATAKFSDQSEFNTGNVWTARGSVDSQNSFGAILRNQYRCETKYLDDADQTYQLVRLDGLTN